MPPIDEDEEVMEVEEEDQENKSNIWIIKMTKHVNQNLPKNA